MKRVVVKIGTGLLIQDETINRSLMQSLVRQIAKIKKEHHTDIILVSSGAIGCGAKVLGQDRSKLTLPQSQAAAAVGQSRLMHVYNGLFQKQNLLSAQILVTRDDLQNRLRYLNADNTLRTLLQENVVPIINENDTVSVDEIKLGDNDVLAAYVSIMLKADMLIILSNVDGLLDLKQKKRIKQVSFIDQNVWGLVSGEKSALGTGGMKTKLDAAQMVTQAGEEVVIANGNTPNVLLKIMAGKDVGTRFKAGSHKMSSKKRWIAFAGRNQGELTVDQGAQNALVNDGKSLLASGVVSVSGTFQSGDVVHILYKNNIIAKGLSNYSAEDLKKIKGLKSNEVKSLLSSNRYDEVVHRNHMVLLQNEARD